MEVVWQNKYNIDRVQLNFQEKIDFCTINIAIGAVYNQTAFLRTEKDLSIHLRF